MTVSPPNLPKWILVVSALFTLLELAGSISICFYPESMGDAVDLNAKGVDYLLYMWGSRQFALACILGFATVKRSVPMLSLAYLFLLVMFVGDLAVGFSQQNNSLIIAALAMGAVAAALLLVLVRKSNFNKTVS